MEQEVVLPNSFQVHEGLQIEHYKMLGKLGMGGMGVVYKAYDMEMDRPVAVKFMIGQAESRDRFLREMKISSQLSHPHIVQVYHTGVWNNFPYFAMEYVDGLPLHKYLAQTRPTLEQKLSIIIKIASALAYAHAQKVLHRDIKPSNIMVKANGEPTLMDFGLAKTTALEDRSLTRTGTVIGTAEYMAPEQARGLKRAIDERSDVYALGAVLYHALTGSAPISGETLIEKIHQVIEVEPVMPRKLCPDIPPALERVCMQAMQKNKAHRYASADAFADDIGACLRGLPTWAEKFLRRRRVRCAALILCVFLLLTAVAWGAAFWLRHSGPARTPQLPAVSTLASEISRYYEIGANKLQQNNPQEAYIYLEKAAQLLASDDGNLPKSFVGLKKILPAMLAEAAFAAGQYRQAYAAGIAITHESAKLSWLLGRAAYHSALWQEARQHFARAMSLTYPEHKAGYAAEIMGYDGLICYHQQRFGEAKNKLTSALQLLAALAPSATPDPRLTGSCCIYLCAAILLDWEEPLAAADADCITRYWSQAEKYEKMLGDGLLLPRELYLETQARLLINQANCLSGAGRRPKAEQAIAVVRRLLSAFPETSPRHYMLGKAYALAEDYTQAETAFNKAWEMDPGQFSALLESMDVSALTPRPWDMNKYFIAFPLYKASGVRLPTETFTPEWQLREKIYCDAVSGISFSPELFEEYFSQLAQSSLGLRQIVKTVLCSMVPHDKVRQELRRKAADVNQEMQAVLAALDDEIVATELRRQQAEFLRRLSQIPLQERWDAGYFYPQHVPRLKRVLQEEPDVFLRFLAARVLAYIPALDTRGYLMQKYVDSVPEAAAAGEPRGQRWINRLLALRALHETGYRYPLLQPQFYQQVAALFASSGLPVFCHDRQQEEFVQSCLAEVIPAADKQTAAVLGWLLQYGSERVKLATARQFPWPQDLKQAAPSVYNALMECLSNGLLSPTAEVRIVTIATITGYLASYDGNTAYQWADCVVQHLLKPHIVQRQLQDLLSGDADVQKAVLRLWQTISPFLDKIKQPQLLEQMRVAFRQLWTNKDPVLRSQAIVASSTFLDREVFDKYGFASDARMLERISTLVGLFQNNHYGKMQELGWIVSQFTSKRMDECKDWRAMAIVLYLFGGPFGDSLMVFKNKVVPFLQHDNPSLRCVAVFCIANWRSISDKVYKDLKRMAREDSAPYVRAAASGVVINCLCRQNSPDLQQWHRQAKQKRDDGPDYRLTAAWGYALPWTNSRNLTPARVYMCLQDAEQQWQLLSDRFLHSCKDANVAEYEKRLRMIVDLLEGSPDCDRYVESQYLLALLYERKGDFANSGEILARMMQRLGSADTLFTSRWTDLAIRQGHLQEARDRLQAALGNVDASADDYRLEVTGQRAAYASMLRHNLAKVLMAGGDKSDAVRALLHTQHLLAPRQTTSLLSMVQFHYARSEFSQAFDLLRELQARLPANAEVYVWLARMYMLQNDKNNVLKNISRALFFKPTLTLQEVSHYPELRHFADSQEMKALWERE